MHPGGFFATKPTQIFEMFSEILQPEQRFFALFYRFLTWGCVGKAIRTTKTGNLGQSPTWVRPAP